MAVGMQYRAAYGIIGTRLNYHAKHAVARYHPLVYLHSVR